MNLRDLQKKIIDVKRRFAQMYFKANAGHIGSALSCAELLACIRLAFMSREDYLILSKGHAAAALYSVLVESGEVTEEELEEFYRDGTRFAAHPPANKIPGIPFATGSLGHGLSLAAGLALGIRFKGQNRRVHCLCSDGELNEGSIWEAALFIAQHKLSGLTWWIDRNGWQGFGATEEVLALEPLADKLCAFNFSVVEVAGHDLKALLALEPVLRATKNPIAVIAHTQKGKTWSRRENSLESHYLPFRADDYEDFIRSLNDSEKEWTSHEE